MNSSKCLACGASVTPQHPCARCGFTWLGSDGQKYDYEERYDDKALYNALSPQAVLEHYRRAPNTSWALERLAQLKAAGQVQRLLELGSSQGAFLALAREQGLRVHGIELASASVEYARRELGLTEVVEHGPWRPRRDDEAPLDAVCAFEVLEHSEDPRAFLSLAASWLRPGGYLFLSVPNGRRLNARLGRREEQDRPPHHLMYWTRRSLEAALSAAGYREVHAFTSALTHSDLANLLVPALSAHRAAELGSIRPVGSAAPKGKVPSGLRRIYPLLTSAARLVARAIDQVPELGSRLIAEARRPER